jgi:hypothetical protein
MDPPPQSLRRDGLRIKSYAKLQREEWIAVTDVAKAMSVKKEHNERREGEWPRKGTKDKTEKTFVNPRLSLSPPVFALCVPFCGY